jgi:two-component system phosphate regulon response regulator PhoB
MSEQIPLIASSATADALDSAKMPLVLIVDDHADTRDLFRYVVEKRGCSVIEAADGGEAVRLAESRRPDLILMDTKLPDFDGLEATRQIRQTQTVPIIILSAQAQAHCRGEALDAGANDYFVKPVKLNDLELVIEDHLLAQSWRAGT